MSTFLRKTEGEEQRAGWLELFFDLVFVFAITQLSHFLLAHLSVEGAAQTLLLLLVVWWAWNYTAWMTNWFDPDSIVVRLVLIAVMLAGLLMAIAIPDAFGDRGLLFGCAYAALQIVRNAFAVYGASPQLRAPLVNLLVWSLPVGALWIAGGFVDDEARVGIWLAALALDYAGPYAGYWNPWRGRIPSSDWEIDSSHFSERFQLFVIIALGESIVVTGATASDLDIDLTRGTAIAIAFLGTAAMWWLYFSYVARIAPLRLKLEQERTRMARDAYTYLHLPMIAGIIVTAVGDELVIAHPDETLHTAELVVLAGGPALYLLGHVGFRLRMTHSVSYRRLTAAAAICAAGALGAVLPALATATLIVAVLVALIAVETTAMRRQRARGEPSPIERLMADRG